MIHSEKAKLIYEKLFSKLEPYHNLLFEKKALLAYSGGKDSNLLLHFYDYLSKTKKIPSPILFHMDHSIRKNEEQEKDILNYLSSLPYKFYSKKKKFRVLLPGLKKA